MFLTRNKFCLIIYVCITHTKIWIIVTWAFRKPLLSQACWSLSRQTMALSQQRTRERMQTKIFPSMTLWIYSTKAQGKKIQTLKKKITKSLNLHSHSILRDQNCFIVSALQSIYLAIEWKRRCFLVNWMGQDKVTTLLPFSKFSFHKMEFFFIKKKKKSIFKI